MSNTMERTVNRANQISKSRWMWFITFAVLLVAA